jgi:hypothetical protein
MRRAAGLHANQARSDIGEKRQKLRTRQLAGHRQALLVEKCMNLKIPLAQIGADSDKMDALHG